MSKWGKFLEKMINNPRDWQIEDLKKIADSYGMIVRQPGTSHVTFTKSGTKIRLTVPSHKPIKPVYIKKFLELIDELDKESN